MTTILSRNNETFIASVDLRLDQFKFVKLVTNADNTVTLTNGSAEQSIGILLVPGDADTAVTVTTHGRTAAIAAEAITRGQPIASNGAALAIPADNTGDIIMGYALESAAIGDLFSIELIQGGNVV